MDVYRIFSDYFNQFQPGLGILAGALLKRLDEGHMCLDLKTLDDDHPEEALPAGILLPGPYVSHDPSALKPFIVYLGNLYFQRYFLYETNIEQKIRQLIAEGSKLRNQRIRELEPLQPLIKELFKENAEAFRPALLGNFCIITGGPGAGKTTLAREVLRVLYARQPDLKVALAAPTGKAAARINESMTVLRQQIPGLPMASTIHRLLGSVNGSIFFRHDEENPMNHDITIVDEASMIDGALMAKLLNATSPEKRLILLGDKDQLASIEAGSVFGDLCKTEGTGSVLDGHVIRLTKSHRFDADKGIGLFSRSVLAGDSDCIVRTMDHPDDALSIDTTYDDKLFHEFAVMYRDYITEPDIATALEKIGKIRVLCAIREGEHGVYQTNRRIAGYLCSLKLPIEPSAGFYHNQSVMVTSNMYALKVFNGDVGIIRRDPLDPGNRLYAWFPGPDGNLMRILPGYLTHWETVFAMTINKSQGSEFENVLVLLPDNKDVRILTRELLYTAVTRGQKRVLVQAPQDVLEETVRKRISRVSGLANRLKA